MRLALAASLAAAVAVAAAATEPRSAALRGSRPNVVVWFFDDTGHGDSSVYNSEVQDTPSMQKLADEGLVFDDFHAGASVCTPSRAALLTGRLGLRTGVTHNFNPQSIGGLPLREMTLGEMFKGAGYKTAMLGKWHLGADAPFHPSFRGFDEYHGLPYSNDMGCTNTPDFDKPMIKPCPYDSNASSVSGAGTVEGVPQHHSNHDPELLRLWGDERALELDEDTATPVEGYDLAVPLYNSTTNCSGHASCNADIVEQPVNLTTLNTRYGDWAVDFVQRSAGGEDPFFLYVPTAHMHVPLAHLPRYRNASKGNSVFTDTLLEADTTLGRVMDAIRADSRISDNTLVFVTSDNGPWNVKCEFGGSQGKFLGKYQESLGGGGTGKFTTWEGGHREFGIAWWPGKIDAGKRTNALASTLDFMTTFAPLAGATLPTDRSWDGLNLAPVLFDGVDAAHSTLYHPDGKGQLNAMRAGDLKLYWQTYPAADCAGHSSSPRKHDPPLVFDLSKDPAESTPITLPKDQLERIEAMRATKLADISSTYHSVANYSSGGAKAQPCCDPSHVVCRCNA